MFDTHSWPWWNTRSAAFHLQHCLLFHRKAHRYAWDCMKLYDMKRGSELLIFAFCCFFSCYLLVLKKSERKLYNQREKRFSFGAMKLKLLMTPEPNKVMWREFQLFTQAVISLSVRLNSPKIWKVFPFHLHGTLQLLVQRRLSTC